MEYFSDEEFQSWYNKIQLEDDTANGAHQGLGCNDWRTTQHTKDLHCLATQFPTSK